MSWDDLSKNEMEWPERLRVPELSPAGLRDSSPDLIAEHPGLAAGHAPDRPGLAALGALHGLRARAHPSRDFLGAPAGAASRSRAPAGGVSTAPSQRAARRGRRHPALAGPRGGPRLSLRIPSSRCRPGRLAIGKDPSFPSYGWDNEYGRRETKVEAFAASRHLVTNGEFLEFVAAGGYREERWWTRRWLAVEELPQRQVAHLLGALRASGLAPVPPAHDLRARRGCPGTGRPSATTTRRRPFALGGPTGKTARCRCGSSPRPSTTGFGLPPALLPERSVGLAATLRGSSSRPR